MRALAHRLKGTCGNAQAAQLSEIAKLLQFAMAAGELEQAPGPSLRRWMRSGCR
jgi:HPt (histidine-containing phosphotransfer) domain-containing protein